MNPRFLFSKFHSVHHMLSNNSLVLSLISTKHFCTSQAIFRVKQVRTLVYWGETFTYVAGQIKITVTQRKIKSFA